MLCIAHSACVCLPTTEPSTLTHSTPPYSPLCLLCLQLHDDDMDGAGPSNMPPPGTPLPLSLLLPVIGLEPEGGVAALLRLVAV